VGVGYSLGMDRLWTPWRYAYVTGQDKGMAKRGVPQALAAWPGEMDCVFCNMLAATEYAVEHGMTQEEADAAVHILERGKSCFVVLNAFPYNSGHLMVVPYEHAAALNMVSEDTLTEMILLARQAEAHLRAVYKPDGLNMGINIGKAAGAGVAGHIHLHVLPRWVADANFMTTVGEARILPEDLDVTYEKLSRAWSGSGPHVGQAAEKG